MVERHTSTSPSPRASSARETAQKARRAEAHERSAQRPDPTQLPNRSPVGPDNPANPNKEDWAGPQQGLSSSELNTTHPAVKAQATKEAADAPHNNMSGDEQRDGKPEHIPTDSDPGHDKKQSA